MNKPTCTVPECVKPARSAKATLCPMHYHRAYRHGDVTKNARTSSVTVSYGRLYKRRAAKGHPMADANGIGYVHRIVLWDVIGPGAHPCHHCKRVVSWDNGKGHPDVLQVDHLNNRGDDNRPENLVPACKECNSARGAQRRADALREAGFWSINDTIAALSDPQQRRRDRVAA